MRNKLKYFWFGLAGFVSGSIFFWWSSIITGNFGVIGGSFLSSILSDTIVGFLMIGIPYAILGYLILILIGLIVNFIRQQELKLKEVSMLGVFFSLGIYLAYIPVFLFIMWSLLNWQLIL